MFTTTTILSLPHVDVHVDASTSRGPLEVWRHTLGHGGINAAPLPERVVEGVRRLQPRRVRTFIQEFFQVYPEQGRFDWSRLDPYMDALAATGAQVVAALAIKPRVLFPAVDHAVWRPNDVPEWQVVIGELVRRYSVERPIVTHWEIGNETDIGESGGTPFLIPNPDDYLEFYRMAVPPILAAYPAARIGGPAACWIDNEPLPGFIQKCRGAGLPLDFVSWHHYGDDPARHAAGVERARALIADIPGPRPELMSTEWNKGFDPVSVQEMAFDPGRAAIVAQSILAMLDAGLDWSFYYHMWDQVCEPDAFRPFFSSAGVQGMVRHWNETPHRFGLFGVGGEVRPQYFVYQMLQRMGETRVEAHCDSPRIGILAGRGDRSVSVLAAHVAGGEPQDRLLQLHVRGLRPGRRRITVTRIDAQRRWSQDALELEPVERREVDTPSDFQCQVLCPADTVTLAALEDLA